MKCTLSGCSRLLWSASSLLSPRGAAVITGDMSLLVERPSHCKHTWTWSWCGGCEGMTSPCPVDHCRSDAWISETGERSAQRQVSVCLACDSGRCLEKSNESCLSLCQMCVSFGFGPENQESINVRSVFLNEPTCLRASLFYLLYSFDALLLMSEGNIALLRLILLLKTVQSNRT